MKIRLNSLDRSYLVKIEDLGPKQTSHYASRTMIALLSPYIKLCYSESYNTKYFLYFISYLLFLNSKY
jgi:hypothetical protein